MSIFSNWRVIAGIVVAATIYHIVTINGAYMRGKNDQMATFALAQQKADAIAESAIQVADAKHQKDMNDAKAQITRLNADIASGARRLRIHATCPAAGSDSAGRDGPDVADISPADGISILNIAAEGDEAIRRLTLAQEVIRALTADDKTRDR